ncbi:DUF7289 family protein [Haloplanus halophilus]|uniref:DUF7289 family protein n=1 Tax=Haloplanus halophilus TaxID=2949993 RepID=UPI00203D3EA6|nr:hypothetical protein [Haloplanus sp. GDY1]
MTPGGRSPDGSPAARAVSNTVAFVLVFSLIVTSVGLVTTVGLGSLRDVQTSQQAELSTGALRAVGGEIDEIAAGSRPAYRDSIELGGGRITVVDETAVDVTVANATGTVFEETYRPRALTYAYEGRNMSYGSGVLARGSDRQPAVLVSGPSTIRCVPASDVAVVTVVQLVPDDGSGASGGPVTVEARRIRSAPPTNVSRLDYPTTRPSPTATNVSVTVSGPWQAAWMEALTARGFTATGGGTATCPANRVSVRLVRVEIALLT